MKIDSLRKQTNRDITIEQKLARLGARQISVISSPAQNFLPRSSRGDLRVFLTGSSFILLLLVAGHYVQQGNALKKQILGEATTAYENLNSGKSSLLADNFGQAEAKLEAARAGFSAIRENLPLKDTLPGRQAQLLLELGERSARSLQNLSRALAALQTSRLNWDPQTNTSDQGLYASLRASREQLNSGLEELDASLGLAAEVDKKLLPGSAAQAFERALTELVTGRKIVEVLLDLEAFGLNLLGGEPKTYLLVFQNNNEARATGGFIGTYGIVRFANGRMTLERIESIYNLDGQLREKIAAPGPMQRELTKYWGIRDSNWFADFPTSSRKILEFFQKETGLRADGIISFTPDVFERLLGLAGPIAMPAYGLTLTAENFRAFAQYKTSVDYDRAENQPKKFLADFAPLLLQRLGRLSSEQRLQMMALLSDLIAEKHLLMYAADPALQSRIAGYRLGGEILETAGDYLAIIHSNVGGGKTDLKIAQRVEKLVQIDRAGRAVVKLKIIRTHQSFNEKNLPRNLDFMRILVPRGSALISKNGFDDAPPPAGGPGSVGASAKTDPDLAAWDSANEESGYTEFRGWLELAPGQSRSIELTYSLPNSFVASYSQLLQTQGGAPAFTFELTIEYPREIVYTYPASLPSQGGRVVLHEVVKSDRFYAVSGK